LLRGATSYNLTSTIASIMRRISREWKTDNPIKSSGGIILDIGCADGVFAKEIAPYASKVTAVDLSPVMIAAAKNSYQENQVEFIVANAKELPFSNHTFDLTLSRRGPVSEPEFLEEAIRVTKSRGQIIEI